MYSEDACITYNVQYCVRIFSVKCLTNEIVFCLFHHLVTRFLETLIRDISFVILIK